MAGSIFAVSVISSNEHKLFTADKFNRMLESDNPQDAVKVLYEASYGDGMTVSSPYDYEQILFKQEEVVFDFINSISPNKNITDCFFMTNDFLNVKMLLKEKYSGNSGNVRLLKGCLVDSEVLKTAISSGSYGFLPECLKSVIEEIERIALQQSVTSVDIDLCADRARQMELKARLKRIKNRYVKEYFNMQTDLNNIAVIIRLKMLEKNANDVEKFVMPGGSISESELVELFDKSMEQIIEYFKYTQYRDFVNKLGEVYSQNVKFYEFEKLIDDYIIGVFKAHKNDYFNINPVIGYYIASMMEMKNIRIIMTAQLAKTDKQLARERLRECYV